MKCEQIETLLHCTHVYRATLVVAHLGWVDFDFGSSSGCQILLELMGVWQNWLGRCLCGQHDGKFCLSLWVFGRTGWVGAYVGNMMEHPNPIQLNPGGRPPESPCMNLCIGLGERVGPRLRELAPCGQREP